MENRTTKFLVALALVGAFAFVFYIAANIGAEKAIELGFGTDAYDLVGASTNAVSIPNVMAFANSTTTDLSFYADGGQVLTQRINTDGIEKVKLNVLAVGGTVTSTLTIRQQISHDETNWFDIHASSTPLLTNYATSTPIMLSPSGLEFDPGTASTTYSFLLDTYRARFTRFLYMADNLTTDPTDGVQAWIQAIKIRP